MKNLKSKLQFFEGLWAVSPQSYAAYSSYFKQLILNSESETEIKVGANVRYLLDVDGKKITPASDGQTPKDSYGVVNLIGPMVRYGNWWFWGADEFVAMLEAYDNDPNIKGTILNIDSGGGHVSAVAPYLDFMQSKQKPVIALGNTVGSAAMWVAAATDYVLAENNISSAFGSIGVMVNFLSFQKYYKDLGIKEHTIYSNLSDDKNKSFELALQGKYELIKKESLDPLALKFQEDIKKFRGKKLKLETKGLLSGKMFYAEDALENGLIDAIGNEKLAIEKINELSAVQTFINNF